MTVIDGILQGIIQGVTEFLPVSSSGHLSLYQHFSNTSGEGALSFSLMLHLGTLAAVIIVFYKDVLSLIRELFTSIADIAKRNFSIKKASAERRLLFLLIIATLPLFAAVPLMDLISGFAEDDSILIEGICFLITSFLLFCAASTDKSKDKGVGSDKATFLSAVFVGLAQVLALFPGVSRSGSTMSAGLMNGYSKKYAAKFAFLLGIPAILGGATLDFLSLSGEGFSFDILPAVVGFFTSLIVGIASIKLLQFIVNTGKLKIFAYYTLVLGVATVVYTVVSAVI